MVRRVRRCRRCRAADRRHLRTPRPANGRRCCRWSAALQNGIRIIEFADLDLTDYNAPLLGPAAPRDARAARAMWRDLLAALRRMPGGADLIRLRKMPADLEGRPNPLALLDGAGPCVAERQCRRHRRGFRRLALLRSNAPCARNWSAAGACSRAIPPRSSRSSPTRTKRCAFSPTMEAQQGARMQHLGLNFVLNDETCAAFYRNLVGENRRERLCRAVGADRRRGGGRDPARHPARLALRDGADQQCRREMVELLAGPADHRAHHGGAASGWRPAVRFQHRQLRLQAPIRRDADCRWSISPRR